MASFYSFVSFCTTFTLYLLWCDWSGGGKEMRDWGVHAGSWGSWCSLSWGLMTKESPESRAASRLPCLFSSSAGRSDSLFTHTHIWGAVKNFWVLARSWIEGILEIIWLNFFYGGKQLRLGRTMIYCWLNWSVMAGRRMHVSCPLVPLQSVRSWGSVSLIIQPLDESVSTRELISWLNPEVYGKSTGCITPSWKIALPPELPLPGLFDVLFGLITTSCLLSFVLQVVLESTWAQ